MEYSEQEQVVEGKAQAVDLQDDYWHVNAGDEKVHASRIKGRFRTYKWLTASLWLFYFFGPYVRWDGHQAVLFDIVNRKFHIFSITLWPQDVWMLSLVLIFLALTLFVTTAIAGRVFCGYFCFQTVWTDVFTFIEDKLEGSPPKRRKLDAAPWTGRKILIKVVKHTLWLVIAVLTGVTFGAYFADAHWLWVQYLTLKAPLVAWITLLIFVICTYVFAGFMREQVCFWLCPYARIQGVMYDPETILPTYDKKRAEPRSRLKKGQKSKDCGDCIDCNLCVAVCPTGIDIRHGHQEGCITCGLCIDACDSIMDKVNRPKGLIRYASLDEIEGKPKVKLFTRPRVIIYVSVLFVAFTGILYGLMNLGAMSVSVLHERQPLFVRLSDGSIQNKYIIKVVNKAERKLNVSIDVEGLEGMEMAGKKSLTSIPKGKVLPITVFLKVPLSTLTKSINSIFFKVSDSEDPNISSKYKSMFMGPKVD